MADHLAESDAHALQLCRDAVANLHTATNEEIDCLNAASVEEPLYPAEELYGIIPSDAKQPFDIRAV